MIWILLLILPAPPSAPAEACEALSGLVRVKPARLAVCEEIGAEALIHGVPVELAISLCWHESRFSMTAVSRSGARGPCQVLPKYAECTEEGRPCDWIEEGIWAMVKWSRRAWAIKGRARVTDADMVAMYHAGHRPPPSSYRYARKVIRLTRRLQTLTRRTE